MLLSLTFGVVGELILHLCVMSTYIDTQYLGLRTIPYNLKWDVRYGLYGSHYHTVSAPNGHSNSCTQYSTGRSRIQLDKNGCNHPFPVHNIM